jgi:hypothetical protein
MAEHVDVITAGGPGGAEQTRYLPSSLGGKSKNRSAQQQTFCFERGKLKSSKKTVCSILHTFIFFYATAAEGDGRF